MRCRHWESAQKHKRNACPADSRYNQHDEEPSYLRVDHHWELQQLNCNDYGMHFRMLPHALQHGAAWQSNRWEMYNLQQMHGNACCEAQLSSCLYFSKYEARGNVFRIKPRIAGFHAQLRIFIKWYGSIKNAQKMCEIKMTVTALSNSSKTSTFGDDKHITHPKC